MRRAFTMIELLVATMLLAMLVTILTMMFNQSSIAWTTGLASVTGLGNAREHLPLDLAPAGKDLLAVLGGGVGDTATRFELHTGGSDPIIFIGRFLGGKLQLPPLPGKDIPGLGVELRLLFIGNVGY